jgi:hypothetical protein
MVKYLTIIHLQVYINIVFQLAFPANGFSNDTIVWLCGATSTPKIHLQVYKNSFLMYCIYNLVTKPFSNGNHSNVLYFV